MGANKMDEYIVRYRKAVKNAKNNKELTEILDKLCSDGFEDGANNSD
ncbi:MAG: hypothetical protein KKA51_07875 [Nanoarchaeota archaeon]|nr:hypothetical protein [Nanoarchaeota archaeon]